jgi:hypothetical protein
MATLYLTDDLIHDDVRKNYFDNHTISFEQVTTSVQFGFDRSLEVYYAAPAGAADPLQQGDWFLAQKVILTEQDDYFEIGLEVPVAEVWGGAGNDILITDDDTSGTFLYGGAGDDLLVSHFPVHTGRNHLVGGDGNDVLVAGDDDEMSGGAGTDYFVLSDTRSAFITDLAIGTEQVDLWRVLGSDRNYYLSFSEAVADQALRVAYQNGYTYIYYNPRNYTGSQEYLLTYMKGSVPADQYDRTFNTVFANSYDNRPAIYAKVLDGTANPARDHLVGDSGKDVLILGDTDEATANGGYDRFVLTNLTGASAFITDLTDKVGNALQTNAVDMAKPLYEAGYSYSSFSEAEAAGTLAKAYVNGYTYLYYDADGDHIAEHEFAHIKGVAGVSVDNIFLVAPAQSYFSLHAVA